MSPRSSAVDPFAAYSRYRRRVRLGQALMVVGGVIAAVHLVMHLAGSPSGWTDLAAGYPIAGLIFLAGVWLAGQTEPKRKR
ncbi:hypothetical protein N864_23630 [Intrasporangium chromatireducens Q5-1]|uniref:Uncharacterized protein n=1 Tax=Intrasporangium chromatireducens Q5-1 TaxID=584657 RepID=W9GV51_9MICO|nr:hypothetical protein [Intrasporangium chromatireducens]EWT07754.1 hypothetical protein N864_23630 [Intrasporangium chromatireducens Q5-1]